MHGELHEVFSTFVETKGEVGVLVLKGKEIYQKYQQHDKYHHPNMKAKGHYRYLVIF